METDPAASQSIPSEKRDLYKRVFQKAWGGPNSPFMAIFAVFVQDGKYDSLLIAKRHEYIGEALRNFTKDWLFDTGADFDAHPV